MVTYVADFETRNDDNGGVWLWGCMNTEYEKWNYGTNIETFMSHVEKLTTEGGIKVYFHNLKFDGSFILNYILGEGYNYTSGNPTIGEFKSIIDDMGQFYSIEICYGATECKGKKKGKRRSVTFVDSLKLIPLSVDTIGKKFKLGVMKGDIAYNKYRPTDYIPTEEELDYLHRDMLVVCRAIKIMGEMEINKLTLASSCLTNFKKLRYGQIYKKSADIENAFRREFPLIGTDYVKTHNFLKRSYKGGWVYANPKYQGVRGNEGLVYDVNSLYPSVMRYEVLPYGKAQRFLGEYVYDENYPLYIVEFECMFVIKEGHLPFVQIKNSPRFLDTEYLTDSEGIVKLVMTNVDLELFKKHYDIDYIEYIQGYKFKGKQGIFDTYIDTWMDIKIKAEEEGNGALRQIAKLMLNSLYGKFGSKVQRCCKIPYLEEGILKFRMGEMEEVEPLYLPMASFITSYARRKTITSAQDNYDRFLYADTDSIHLIGTTEPRETEYFNIDKYKLGAWKCEMKFSDSVYLKAKTYAELSEEGLIVKCAGLSKAQEQIKTIDQFMSNNFGKGFNANKSRQVRKGVAIKSSKFKLKV